MNSDRTAFEVWVADAQAGLAAAETFYGHALKALREQVSRNGRIVPDILEQQQHAAHGLAWLATYVQGLREVLAYSERLDAEQRFGTTEFALSRIAFGE